MGAGDRSGRLRDAKHYVGRSSAEVVRSITSRHSIGYKANFMCSYIVDFEDYARSYYEDPEDYSSAIEPYRQRGLDESCRPGHPGHSW
jgi:hypothetical protein